MQCGPGAPILAPREHPERSAQPSARAQAEGSRRGPVEGRGMVDAMSAYRYNSE